MGKKISKKGILFEAEKYVRRIFRTYSVSFAGSLEGSNEEEIRRQQKKEVL